jgi:hypothetical protein
MFDHELEPEPSGFMISVQVEDQFRKIFCASFSYNSKTEYLNLQNQNPVNTLSSYPPQNDHLFVLVSQKSGHNVA